MSELKTRRDDERRYRRAAVFAARLLMVALASLVLPAFALAQTGGAPKGNPRLASLNIEIWPEYDRPAALVILRGALAESVKLPAAVTLRLPAASGGPGAVAYSKAADGNLLNLKYESAKSGDFITLKFEVRRTVLSRRVLRADCDRRRGARLPLRVAGRFGGRERHGGGPGTGLVERIFGGTAAGTPDHRPGWIALSPRRFGRARGRQAATDRGAVYQARRQSVKAQGDRTTRAGDGTRACAGHGRCARRRGHEQRIAELGASPHSHGAARPAGSALHSLVVAARIRSRQVRDAILREVRRGPVPRQPLLRKVRRESRLKTDYSLSTTRARANARRPRSPGSSSPARGCARRPARRSRPRRLARAAWCVRSATCRPWCAGRSRRR